MDSFTIAKSLEKYEWIKNKFCGVYAINKIPDQIMKPCSLVINTHESYLPGEHWISIYINKKGDGYYFDSFGKKPNNMFVLNFLNKHCNKYYTKNKRIQSFMSTTCGHYCILFIAFMCKNYNLEDFYNLFSNNTFYNDILIKSLYSKIFYNND